MEGDDKVILGLQHRIQGLEHDLGACRISNKMYMERNSRIKSYYNQIKGGSIQFDLDVLLELVDTYKYSGWNFVAKDK